MKKLIIHNEKVTKQAAEELLEICKFGAIDYDEKNNKLDINAACKTCGLCVRKGSYGVCELIEEEGVKAINKDEWVGVCVYVEHDGNEIHPVVFELIGKARELTKVTNHPVYAVVMCDDVNKFKQELLEYGVDKVYAYEDPKLAHFDVIKYAECMEDFIKKVKPSAILYGGTSTGRSFAPRLAARFKTGLTADCTILGMKENTDMIQNRPAFGGNIMASIICTNTRPQMSTVRYKIFSKPEKETPHGEIVMMSTKALKLESKLHLLDIKKKDNVKDISEADILVACGRAFKTEEDLKIAYELAEALGGQVASSRPLVEAGLFDAKKQIGLSGRTVAPKLLITLGISGAVQFAAGMSGSEVVFSINSDPNAPIFEVSHYGIVGNVFEIVPELIKKINDKKAGK